MVHLSAAQMKLLVLRKIFFLCSIFLCFILLCVTLIGVCRRWQFLLLWLEGFYPPIWLSGYSFAPLSTKSVVLFSVVGTFFFSWGWKTRPLVCWGFRVHTTWRLPRGPKFIHSRLLWCCLSLVVLAHKAWIWTLNLSPKSNYYFKDWFIWGVAVQFCEIKDVPP